MKRRKAKKKAKAAPASDVQPGLLLHELADLLTRCQEAGVQVKLKHGVVYTKYGYVLPLTKRWVARSLAYTEFSVPDDPDDD